MTFSGPTFALTFGGTGAPMGMFLITGSGSIVALLNVASKLPSAIGPWTSTPFLTNVMPPVGCVHSDPWNFWALFVNEIDGDDFFSVTSVSMSLCPLLPCQFEKTQ